MISKDGFRSAVGGYHEDLENDNLVDHLDSKVKEHLAKIKKHHFMYPFKKHDMEEEGHAAWDRLQYLTDQKDHLDKPDREED